MMKSIAVYHGFRNVSGENVARALRKLRIPHEMIDAKGIAAGRLASFGAVIFPGGHSIRITDKALKETYRFVERGGGLIGICAGAQFGAHMRFIPVRHKVLRASGIFDMRVVTKHPVTRGYAVSRPTPKGKRWRYTHRGRIRIRYTNGGVLIPSPGVTPLVVFDEEGKMPAIVAGKRGRGKVVLMTPHPESTPPPEDCGRWVSDAAGSQDPLTLFVNAVRYVAGC
jgi:glutamine amidotransferase-like uncharacterized protein